MTLFFLRANHPAGHAAHGTVDATSAYLPCEHATHNDESGLAVLPASHASHDLNPLLDVINPAGHFPHFASSSWTLFFSSLPSIVNG